MWIVAFGAAPDHPVAVPVIVPFAVGPADPVFLLPEMTLTAELVGMVKIDLVAPLEGQEVTLLFMVTGGAGELLLTMTEIDSAVGQLEAVIDLRLVRLSGVATATAEAFDLILSGFDPE